MAFALLFPLTACETAPPAPDLPPVHPPGRTSRAVEPPVNPDIPRAQARVYLQQFMLPLELPTDPAWGAIDEASFPAVTRSVWNANGLRVGLVDRDDLAEVLRQLPGAYSNQQQMVTASTHPSPVRRSPPLTTPFTVDLTIPPLAVREERLFAGRAQLLLSVDAGQTLYLTPHHHKLQPRLTPVSILEKELEGRIFQELTLAVPPGRQRVLVVGLHRPWPVKRDESGEPLKATPDNPFAPYDLGREPPLHDDLGRALFTGVIGGQPAQIVLFITVEPLR